MEASQAQSSISRRAFLALASTGCLAACSSGGGLASRKIAAPSAPGLAAPVASALARPSANKMTFPEKDWTFTPPESEGVDPVKMNAALDFLAVAFRGQGGIEEMLIVRNGRAIWRGAYIDVKHGIWSASKSFSSTVLGLLIDDGKCTLDTLAKDFVPELAADYPKVKLRHFATMTSGYDGEGGSYPNDPLDGSATPFIPTKPFFAPGTQYRYWDDAMREFGHVLTRIAGETLESFFRRRVAEPIGMPASDWGWRVRGTVRGVEIMDSAGGIDITARQLARFGHLFLNRGEWAGKRIVSADWVAQASAVQVPLDMPWKPFSKRQQGIDGRGVYGFNWWLNGVSSNGTRPWQGAPDNTYAASGFNENKCFVIPEWNMIVVRTGTAGSKVRQSENVWGTFLGMLAKAIS